MDDLPTLFSCSPLETHWTFGSETECRATSKEYVMEGTSNLELKSFISEIVMGNWKFEILVEEAVDVVVETQR